MYEKAVICTDLSADSDALVQCVAHLQSIGMRSVVLTHVVDIFSPSAGSQGAGACDAAFQRQVKVLEDHGITVTVDMPLGHAAFSLDEVSRRHRAGLIVVGSGSTGWFGAPFSDSASSDKVQLSRTPVLLASPGAVEMRLSGDCPSLLSNVLYATDFSDTAERAFGHLAYAVRMGAKRITLLHVQDTDLITRVAESCASEFDRRDAIRLIKIRERLEQCGSCDVTCDIVSGTPTNEVSRRSAEGEFTYVVLGSHGRSLDAQGPLGGVSDSVIRDSIAPVLLVPSPGVGTRAS
ncbi:MAG: universal stress protein [Actinomycetota bacterium]|nr:universal stress protein [Actinomycetota bacterium]